MCANIARSKYEMVRIISARALQLAQGAPPLIKVQKSVVSPMEVAKLEWDAGIIPIEARRRIL